MVVKEYLTLIGKVTIGEEDGYVTNIYLKNDILPNNVEVKETPLIKETIRQINLYLSGKLKKINVPIKVDGTNFQNLVWKQLTNIEYGKTCTYKEVAIAIGNVKACRAVGNANNRNKLPIIIPCHRVIGTNSKLVGYAGGLDIKEMLLNIEKKHN